MSYTCLTGTRFMSEIRNYKKLSLGEAEQLFIILFAQNSFSAYGLWLQMKITKPMSYKNVFMKIQRLLELGLLEPLEGKFKRKAIKYRLTTRGLFERLTLTGWDALYPIMWYDYRDNVILQTILYRFFKSKTVWKFREAGYGSVATLVNDYLRKCCEGLLKLAKGNLTPKQHDVEHLLRTELRDLILKIVIMSSMDEVNWDRKEKASPNENAYMTLRGDKEFSAYLLELREDFDRGYKRFGSASYAKSS
jgi:hypothetical protein